MRTGRDHCFFGGACVQLRPSKSVVKCPESLIQAVSQRAPELVTATRRARGVSPSSEYAWRAYPESKNKQTVLSGEVSEWSTRRLAEESAGACDGDPKGEGEYPRVTSTPGVLILRVKKQADSFYLVRCPSGRRSTPGKCVYGNVSRVRIPPSPPKIKSPAQCRVFYFSVTGNSDENPDPAQQRRSVRAGKSCLPNYIL